MSLIKSPWENICEPQWLYQSIKNNIALTLIWTHSHNWCLLMQGHSHQTAWETGLIWQKSSAVFEFVCDDFMWKVAGSLRWWWCHQLHYIIILIWVYYCLLLILINQVNWLLLQFHSNKTLFICELTLWFFLFFPAFPCCICAHQVCQLAPAGPVGAGALHWLWENISAMAVLRLWVILKWAFYLWSYVLWTENNLWRVCGLQWLEWKCGLSEKGQVWPVLSVLWHSCLQHTHIELFCLSLRPLVL